MTLRQRRAKARPVTFQFVRIGRIGAIATAGVLAACPAAVALAQVGQGPSLAPRPVLVSAHGKTVAASAGSYCVDAVPKPGSEEDLAECTDVDEPTSPPRPRLTVRPRDLLLLQFQDNPETQDDVGSVRVFLTRIDREGPRTLARMRTRRVDGTPDRWRVRLPARLRQANSLYIQAAFDPDGSSDYRSGLQEASRR